MAVFRRISCDIGETIARCVHSENKSSYIGVIDIKSRRDDDLIMNNLFKLLI